MSFINYNGLLISDETPTGDAGTALQTNFQYIANTLQSLASTFTGYVTTSALTSTLAGYVTSSALTADLANYVTGSSLTSTLAAYLTSTGNGSGLMNLNASNLATGTVATARLGTGMANSTTYLRGDGSWQTVSGGVTSVGLSLPTIFSVTGSPVTSSGTLAATLANQTATYVFAGPVHGSSATAPTFRALLPTDIPSLPTSIITSGTFSTSLIPNIFNQSLDTSSDVSFSSVTSLTMNGVNNIASNGNDSLQIGDIYSYGNNTNINIDDDAQCIYFSANATVYFPNFTIFDSSGNLRASKNAHSP